MDISSVTMWLSQSSMVAITRYFFINLEKMPQLFLIAAPFKMEEG
jgi:hypothetical protein